MQFVEVCLQTTHNRTIRENLKSTFIFENWNSPGGLLSASHRSCLLLSSCQKPAELWWETVGIVRMCLPWINFQNNVCISKHVYKLTFCDQKVICYFLKKFCQVVTRVLRIFQKRFGIQNDPFTPIKIIYGLKTLIFNSLWNNN